jgi:hypothetical protein
MSLQQQKERLKENSALEKKEKHLKDQANAKNMKAISAEILKYDLEGYDNFKKVVGLLWHILITKTTILKTA